MQLALPMTEALALATAVGPLPPTLLAVRAHGATVEADVDAGKLGGGGLMGLLGRAAGTVTVAATFAGFSAGTAVFTITAHARGMSVDGMLGQVSGLIPRLATKAGLPPDVAELRTGAQGPELVVHVQRAVDAKVSGVVVEDLLIADGTAHITATVAQPRFR